MHQAVRNYRLVYHTNCKWQCLHLVSPRHLFCRSQSEEAHRGVKERWERTNNVTPEEQIVNMDARESRMREMAAELTEIGVDIPGVVSHSDDVAEPVELPPEAHHHIAGREKNPVDLGVWQDDHRQDPAVQVTFLLTSSLTRTSTQSTPIIPAQVICPTAQATYP